MQKLVHLLYLLFGKMALAHEGLEKISACIPFDHKNLAQNLVATQSNSLSELLEQSINSGTIFSPLLLTFLAGFLTSLSPCVYPLIPITLSVMGARSYKNSIQGLMVSLAYVLGMSLTYCTLGIVFASLGILMGSFLQNPLVLLSFALFFIVMALVMWGILDFNLPPNITSKLSQVGKKGFKGAFLMGTVAGLIAAPCTGPVLGFILALIAQGQNPMFASFLMLSFSLGLGTIFLFLGTFSSLISSLPRSGQWLNAIKYLFASIILSAGFYYLSLAYYQIDSIFAAIKSLDTVWTVTALLVFILLGLSFSFKGKKYVILSHTSYVLVALILAVFFRWSSLPDTLKGTLPTLDWHVVHHKMENPQAFEQLLAEAKDSCKPIIIDFYADWCVACRELDGTLHDIKVFEFLQNFYLIRVDSTKSSQLIRDIQNDYGVTGLPTLVFLDENLQEIKELRILGFIRPNEFFSKILSNSSTSVPRESP